MSLAPPLTALDRRLLALIDRPHGQRVNDLARRLRIDPGEVRSILRGMEHLGYARQAGGWWKRA